MKKKRIWLRVVLLLLIVLISLGIDWPSGVNIHVPKPKITFNKKAPFINVTKNGDLFSIVKDYQIKQGLDLQGGSHLVYSADLSKIPGDQKKDAMDSLRNVIENRVNAFGVAEPLVQTTKSGGEDRVVVELAGVKDTKEAMNLIGKTAQLEFKEFKDGNFVGTGLTGKDFKRADVTFNQTNQPIISIEFNNEGAKKFEEITGRNIGQPLGISLDEQIISAPKVNQQITGGKGVIEGQFDVKTAKELAIQLNAGALPVPIKMVEQRTVGASLGLESIKMSVFAGILGIIFVSLLMISYYRMLGVFSTIGLGLYALFTLAFMKIFDVTLIMGGVAGLILTVGTSMETDVLVFERIKEELRAGRQFIMAINQGFEKTWPSLWDSNVVTLIIAALLYFAGGTVRGFALVLAIGIFIGLFTTFYGTRTLLMLATKFTFLQNYWLFGVSNKEVNR